MKIGLSLDGLAARGPFWALTAHFVKRLFASENEQGGSNLGLGLGMVLAVLASPGAFASIFLLGKYSTLVQFLRGHFIDPIRTSPSDEYFFIVLSMTITGLVMVMRWNRLLPDARDFANLAVLPIPIRNIFLANFAALLSLAIVFGAVVNGVSVLFFPLFVTLSIGSGEAFLQVGVSHAAAVFSASLFSFFGVFALVGLTMLVLPRRWFRPVSIALRILLVVALLTEFFSNLFLQFFAGKVPAEAALYLHLLPSFWFLGLYESMLGIAKSSMGGLGRQGLVALASLIVIAIGAYALCYRRHFLRLSESLDLWLRVGCANSHGQHEQPFPRAPGRSVVGGAAHDRFLPGQRPALCVRYSRRAGCQLGFSRRSGVSLPRAASNCAPVVVIRRNSLGNLFVGPNRGATLRLADKFTPYRHRYLPHRAVYRHTTAPVSQDSVHMQYATGY